MPSLIAWTSAGLAFGWRLLPRCSPCDLPSHQPRTHRYHLSDHSTSRPSWSLFSLSELGEAGCMSTYTQEDLLHGVDTIQEVRYAIAAMYSLQLYEWFASYVSIPPILQTWTLIYFRARFDKELHLVRSFCMIRYHQGTNRMRRSTSRDGRLSRPRIFFAAIILSVSGQYACGPTLGITVQKCANMSSNLFIPCLHHL